MAGGPPRGNSPAAVAQRRRSRLPCGLDSPAGRRRPRTPRRCPAPIQGNHDDRRLPAATRPRPALALAAGARFLALLRHAGRVAILILGPLGGISAAFMNFSIGFFVGGQVLAGILGSTVTLRYGRKASTAPTTCRPWRPRSPACAAWRCWCRRWSGWVCRSRPPGSSSSTSCASACSASASACSTRRSWSTGCNWPIPSGFAVANILRALTDQRLLSRSIAKLGGGIGAGLLGGLLPRARGLARGDRASPPRRSARA